MLDETARIRASHYLELLDIQAVSICGHKWHEHMSQKYERIKHGDSESLPESPPDTTKPILKAESKEAAAQVLDLMAAFRRGSHV